MSRSVNTPVSEPHDDVASDGLGEPADEPEPSLADRAYRAIRDQLIMLEIRPGIPLREDRLMAAHGVGRTPVREALKRLEHERLVVTYARRGTFATDVNITDLAHISEVRLQLEPAAAELAARRARPADRGRLESLADQLEQITWPDSGTSTLMRFDVRVHREIYRATKNPFLEETLIRYDNLATRIWCLFTDRLDDVAGHINEHGPLLRAIAKGDAGSAVEMARAHVTDFERAIRAVI